MMDSNGPVLIGVDGGGSGCRAAVQLPDGRPRFEAAGASANFTTDPDGSLRNVTSTVEAACAAAGLEPEDLAKGVAHVGLAGVINMAQRARISAALPFSVCEVTDDRPTAVAGALGGADGHVIAAGTGSFVARSIGGDAAFVGGWGLRLGDEASAAWVGRRILSRVLHCEDGLSTHSDVTSRILADFEQGSAVIVEFAATATPFDFGAFAPAVVTAARAGDANAMAVMREGAAYLVRALRVLEFEPGGRLCAMGGIGGQYVAFLAQEFTANIVPPAGTPLDGAMILAARRAVHGAAAP